MDLALTKELSKGLSQTIVALSQGSDRNQAFAWDTATAFVARMLDCAERFQKEWSKPTKPASGSIGESREWELG